jgi:hypothetical protein
MGGIIDVVLESDALSWLRSRLCIVTFSFTSGTARYLPPSSIQKEDYTINLAQLVVLWM